MLGFLRRAPLRHLAVPAAAANPPPPSAPADRRRRRPSPSPLRTLPASPSRHLSSSTAANAEERRKEKGGEKDDGPFDRLTKWRQRTRAAESCRQRLRSRRERQINGRGDDDDPLPYDYFHREVASRLVERLDDICHSEEGFPLALEVGAGAGFIHDAICEGTGESLSFDDDDEEAAVGRGGVRKLVQLDSCHAMLHRGDDDDVGVPAASCETYKLVTDEEGPLPFPDGTFDLVVSSMAFHRINNLPGLLLEIKRVLKPDGCLLFALPGGTMLPELRSSFVLAELERSGGVSTHVGPFIQHSDVGSLLTETGFKLPTIDVDEIRIGYPNAGALMEHLSRMGEGNACVHRRERVELETFVSAACMYRELYPLEEEGSGGGEDGTSVVASAQVIYGIAWTEHESQQRPLDRGTATQSIADITVTRTSTEVAVGEER